MTLEHRFFGDSLANNNIGNLTKRYETLTLDNVMLDAVAFIKSIKETLNGTEESQAIVTGGTYCSGV